MQQLRNIIGKLLGKEKTLVVSRQKREAILVRLAEQISRTKDIELTCDEAFELLDRYAELVAEGIDPEPILPQVQQHLSMCKACVEEFDALLATLKSE